MSIVAANVVDDAPRMPRLPANDELVEIADQAHARGRPTNRWLLSNGAFRLRALGRLAAHHHVLRAAPAPKTTIGIGCQQASDTRARLTPQGRAGDLALQVAVSLRRCGR